VKISSVNAMINNLRKKLRAHDIGLDTLREFGWGLGQKDREKIVALIGPRQPRESMRRPLAQKTYRLVVWSLVRQ
jgi:hypothetical protein